MESRPVPIAGKVQSLKQKSGRKASKSWKPNGKGPNFTRQKRVFGAAQNPNIPSNAVPEKPKKKATSVLLEKSSKPTQSPPATLPNPEAKNSSEKNAIMLKKKSVSFQEKENDKGGNSLQKGRVSEPQTPVQLSSVATKPRLSVTPYHSAEKCSKCRLDRLETSSYWLNQIKMAETVGKHFLSAAFFRLACKSKAEPFRNLKVELKKYLGRHVYLKGEDQWRNLLIGYGLTKEEKGTGEAKDAVHANENAARSVEEVDKDSIKEITEETGTTESSKLS